MITNNARNLGFPRMGKRRELKFALEKYWGGQASEAALLATAQELRKEHWKLQQDAGIANSALQRLLSIRPRAGYGLYAGSCPKAV